MSPQTEHAAGCRLRRQDGGACTCGLHEREARGEALAVLRTALEQIKSQCSPHGTRAPIRALAVAALRQVERLR